MLNYDKISKGSLYCPRCNILCNIENSIRIDFSEVNLDPDFPIRPYINATKDIKIRCPHCGHKMSIINTRMVNIIKRFVAVGFDVKRAGCDGEIVEKYEMSYITFTSTEIADMLISDIITGSNNLELSKSIHSRLIKHNSTKLFTRGKHNQFKLKLNTHKLKLSSKFDKHLECRDIEYLKLIVESWYLTLEDILSILEDRSLHGDK